MVEIIQFKNYIDRQNIFRWIVKIYDIDGNGTSNYKVKARSRSKAIAEAYAIYADCFGPDAEPFEPSLIAGVFQE